MTRLRAVADHERGSSALELVIVVPVVLLIISVIAMGGRLALADLAVGSAASEAARSASIARTTPTEARLMAERSAKASLSNQDLDCVTQSVTTSFVGRDGRPAAPGPGENVWAQAVVMCEVNLAGLAIPGIPARKKITKTATSPIDTYRGR